MQASQPRGDCHETPAWNRGLAQERARARLSEMVRNPGHQMKDAVHAAQTESWIEVGDVGEIILSFREQSPLVGDKNLAPREHIQSGIELAALDAATRRGKIEGASSDSDIGLEECSRIPCNKI